MLVRPTLHAKYVANVPRPNRNIEIDTVWAGARPLLVRLSQPAGALEERFVELRAIHDGRSISFLARWVDMSGDGARVRVRVRTNPDADDQASEIPDDERRVWVWDPSARRYFLREIATSLFAFKFCISGSPEACMLNGEEGVYDVWEWRAGWSHIFGYAEDRRLVISVNPPARGLSVVYPSAIPGQAVYMQWQEDAGEPPYTLVDRPRDFQRRLMYGIKAQNPTGSAADVLAEAVHENSLWMLEVKRLLETGYRDDYQISGNGLHPFAIALSDGQEGRSHYTSDLLYLRLD